MKTHEITVKSTAKSAFSSITINFQINDGKNCPRDNLKHNKFGTQIKWTSSQKNEEHSRNWKQCLLERGRKKGSQWGGERRREDMDEGKELLVEILELLKEV